MGDLHILARNGNIKGIKAALKNKRAFLSLDEDLGWSPLHYASNRSKAKAVQVILEGGISPNIKSPPPKNKNPPTKKKKTPRLEPCSGGKRRPKSLRSLPYGRSRRTEPNQDISKF